MSQKFISKNPNKGFTLVELSIVLVIIGLLAGGILVGRDLIEAAQIRAQIKQYDQLTAAVNTFRLKYGGFPGDLLASKAASFGMATRSGEDRHGDGDEVLESFVMNQSVDFLGCETALFWNDLGVAQLFGGSYPLNVDNFISIASGEAGKYLPKAALGDNNFLAVWGRSTTSNPIQCNVPFCVGTAPVLRTVANGQYDNARYGAFTPIQASSIDTKIDDGFPLTGRFLSTSSFLSVSYRLIGGVENECLKTAPNPMVYRLDDNFARQRVCIPTLLYR